MAKIPLVLSSEARRRLNFFARSLFDPHLPHSGGAVRASGERAQQRRACASGGGEGLCACNARAGAGARARARAGARDGRRRVYALRPRRAYSASCTV
eukprot:6185731-Pleurochrysis_carterae.AAC.1